MRKFLFAVLIAAVSAHASWWTDLWPSGSAYTNTFTNFVEKVRQNFALTITNSSGLGLSAATVTGIVVGVVGTASTNAALIAAKSMVVNATNAMSFVVSNRVDRSGDTMYGSLFLCTSSVYEIKSVLEGFNVEGYNPSMSVTPLYTTFPATGYYSKTASVTNGYKIYQLQGYTDGNFYEYRAWNTLGGWYITLVYGDDTTTNIHAFYGGGPQYLNDWYTLGPGDGSGYIESSTTGEGMVGSTYTITNKYAVETSITALSNYVVSSGLIETNTSVTDASTRDSAQSNALSAVISGSSNDVLLSAYSYANLVTNGVSVITTNASVMDAKSRDSAVALALTNYINSATNCVSVPTTNAAIIGAKEIIDAMTLVLASTNNAIVVPSSSGVLLSPTSIGTNLYFSTTLPFSVTASNVILSGVKWIDLVAPAMALAGGAAAPQLIDTGSGLGMQGMGYDNNDEAYGVLQMPHSLALTNANRSVLFIEPHAHWSTAAAAGAGTTNVQWRMIWCWASQRNSSFSFSGTSTVTMATTGITNSYYASFGNITNNGAGISSIFRFKIGRISSGANDYGATRVILDQVDIHVPVDRVGSSQITSQ